MSTNQTITIPADMVGRVRNSLFGALGIAAQEVGQVNELREREAHPEWFAECLASFDKARALIDQLGWTAASPPVAAQIDVDVYGELLLAALRGEVELDDAELSDIEDGRITDPAKVESAPAQARRMREYLASVERELGRSS
jgi:hypothetical protein